MKTTKQIFIILFFLILITPLASTLAGITIGKSVKKGTVPFPQLDNFSFWDHEVKPFLDLSKWFDTNNGAEGVLIRSWNQIRWTLFKVADELVIGEDNWIEDRKTVFELIPSTDAIGSDEIKETVTLIKRFQYHLESKGIQFVMTIIPFKVTVFPEYFPNVKPRIKSDIGILKYQEAFRKNNIPFVDSYSILQNRKDLPTYYKTDLHFNKIGAKLVVDAIIDHLYQSTNKARPHFFNDEIRFSYFDGGSANIAFPMLFPFDEDVPSIEHNYAGDTSTVKINDTVNAAKFSTKRDNELLLPPAILFGNSFTINYPHLGFHDYFQETLRILDYQDFNKALDIIKPETKIVILQVYETQMLFHVSHNNSYNYWDKRVYDLPLPPDFKYQE